jgi:hypothetical protein
MNDELGRIRKEAMHFDVEENVRGLFEVLF